VGANPNAAVQASGGRSFANTGAGTTLYPLHQLAVRFEIDGSVVPAEDLNAAGATISVNGQSLALTLHAPSAGINNVALTAVSDDEFTALLPDGRQIEVVLDSEILDGPADNDSKTLSYLRFGSWAIQNSAGAMTAGAPVFGGYETPAANMPTTGTATYAGDMEGNVSFLSGNARVLGEVEGKAAISANFATNSLTGSVTGTEIYAELPGGNDRSGAWNDFTVTATLSGNGFAGATAVSNAPGGAGTLNAGAAGTVSGTFFGPNANEIGAIWTLSDGATTAVGTIVGMKQ
jgi:hypothetical protein